MAVEVETRSADVCVFEFPEPRPFRTIGMVWRKKNPMARHLDAIAQLVKRAHE